MRFATVAALITVFQYGAEAKVSIANLPETLSHEHADAVGQAHTDAFEMLAEKYSDPLQRPNNQAEMMKELGEIMSSFCDHEPTKESCLKITLNYEAFLDSDGEYPDDFDEDLLLLLDDMYTTLNTLQEDNIDEVLAKINALKTKMKDVDADPIHKHIAMSGAAVAVESTKLWTKVYSDSSHPLFGLHQSSYYAPRVNGNGQVELDPMHGAHRRLEETTSNCFPPILPTNSPVGHIEDDHWLWIPGWGWVWMPHLPGGGLPGSGGDGDDDSDGPIAFLWNRFAIVDIVQADIDGAIFGLLEEADGNPIVIISPTLLFTTSFTGATTRSAAWAEAPPTPGPTTTPTVAPSISCAPSKEPSSAPSPSPSIKPSLSISPSAQPTKAPTTVPSKAPTKTPTKAPTKAPTATPTKSAAPTVTASPTKSGYYYY